ncbi:pyrroloquinoline quinone-dependent dehydrogenase [Phenylobacterium sp.]|jgi:quinoprotein glucose dehydrogenase|uniref:pyrroloquinoline quinone-dependent dehydrogenase n=1 Tax=Phenylobacterium sp. TaxID=1871053 RepID=UPI002E33BF59|nr:pyrroloquinoline quinone-dependent dehydrogenase [Phenylobacterium sp.]HEX3363576.1 pyrroloquinoline quinone-dependent dehydrogenase [Phenylobacterium sp.]
MRKIMMLGAAVAALATAAAARADEWGAYGRDPGGTRFSPLTQISTANVANLKPAWTFHTGDISDGKIKGGGPRSGFETTPLMLDGRLYLTTPFNRVIALNPATGQQLWAYDPKLDRAQPYGDGLINRGLAAWRDPKAGKGPCSLRLYEATLDARLVSVDAATGQACAGFGQGGEVSLRDVARYVPGQYHMTSPPIVVDGVVVVGSAIDDNARADMPDGVVRGFDARTGKLLWSWEPIPKPKDVAEKDWKTGAGNAWTVLSADPKRHLVYVPTGSASPDYWGGLRPGDNRWANSVVALDARTGKLSWGFQLVHHDLWDYDTAAAPLATTLKLKGKATPVVIAGNKTGMVFVLDPATGKPVLPVEERPVPQSTLYGEKSSPTQPFPTRTPALVPQSQGPEAVWAISDADRKFCADTINAMSGHAMFSPPSEQGILAIPGNVGGINWSGFAWDAGHGRLIVSVSNLPAKVRMIPAAKFVKGDHGDLRAETTLQMGTPFAMSREFLRAPSGLPCIKPPFGELVALDLDAGKIAWRVPLGSLEELAPGVGHIAKGSIVLGGPIVTAGGLVFQGGTVDRTLRAFSAADGAQLWSAELPASAHATPMTYEVGGKQYVVVAAGGSAKIDEERQGDAVVAFALP